MRYRELTELADGRAGVIAQLDASMAKYKQSVAAVQKALEAETIYARTAGADCYKVGQLASALSQSVYSVSQASYSYGQANDSAAVFSGKLIRAQQGLRDAQETFNRAALHGEEPPIAANDVITKLASATTSVAAIEAKQATTKASAEAYDKQAQDKLYAGDQIYSACEQPPPTLQ